MSEQVEHLIKKEYAAGFTTDIVSETLPPGLNEDVIRFLLVVPCGTPVSMK